MYEILTNFGLLIYVNGFSACWPAPGLGGKCGCLDKAAAPGWFDDGNLRESLFRIWRGVSQDYIYIELLAF